MYVVDTQLVKNKILINTKIFFIRVTHYLPVSGGEGWI